jgi:hypothetical protein
VDLAAQDNLERLGVVVAACFAGRMHACGAAKSVPAPGPAAYCRRNGSSCSVVITARRDRVRQ